jgi:hypothetical protein
MTHVARRANGDHRLAFRHRARRREHRGTAQAVTNEERRRPVRRAQVRGGGEQVGDVGGKVGVGELAFARAEAGEIKAQAGDATRCQLLRDARGSEDVFAAGEAVREERVRRRGLVGRIEARRELLAAAAGEGDAFGLQGARL